MQGANLPPARGFAQPAASFDFASRGIDAPACALDERLLSRAQIRAALAGDSAALAALAAVRQWQAQRYRYRLVWVHAVSPAKMRPERTVLATGLTLHRARDRKAHEEAALRATERFWARLDGDRFQIEREVFAHADWGEVGRERATSGGQEALA